MGGECHRLVELGSFPSHPDEFRIRRNLRRGHPHRSSSGSLTRSD